MISEPISKAPSETIESSIMYQPNVASAVEFGFLEFVKNDTALEGDNIFSGVSFGAEAPTRKLIAAVCVSSVNAVDSVTIGGVTATKLPSERSVNGYRLAFYIAAVPTGTSGDVVVDCADSGHYAAVGLYRATNIESIPIDSDNFYNPTGSITLDTAAGGFIIHAVAGSDTGGSTTWTEANEDFDEAVGLIHNVNDSFAGASKSSLSEGTITSGTAGAGFAGPQVAVSFSPA